MGNSRRLHQRQLLCIACLAAVLWGGCSDYWRSRLVAADDRETRTLDPQAMSQRIDALIEQKLNRLGWQPAPLCNDTDFIRRAFLDLIGRPPEASEVIRFSESAAPDKRAKLIDDLLNSPLHANHLAQQWTDWMLPPSNDFLQEQGRTGLQNWLRDRFAENLRYDRLVADLMTSTGPSEASPTAFFLALETKPEKVAARTARVFLGVQLDCAQCHDHPFDKWTQRDFWGFAAYFARISNSSDAMDPLGGTLVELDQGEVTLQGRDEIVPPKPLLAGDLVGGSRGTRRQQLTVWMCVPENPMLARAAVNRTWAMLFGRGLVEPVDDLRSIEYASHPELLKELSEYFAATGFDMRNLIRVMANTHAYQRDSWHPSGTPPDASYATMQVKPLTSHQMLASLASVSRQLAMPAEQARDLKQQLGQLRGDTSETKLGIVTALVALHGQTFDAISREGSSRLLQALNGPHMDVHKKIRWIFLATLNCPPTNEEMQALSADLARLRDSVASDADRRSVDRSASGETPGSSANSASAAPDAERVDSETMWLSDLLWALLNSTEFAMTP